MSAAGVAACKLGGVEVGGKESPGRNGFEPAAGGVELRGVLGLDPHQVHGVRAEIPGRPDLVLFGPDAPEGAPGAAVSAQRCAAAAPPHLAAPAKVQVAEQVFVGRLFVVIERQVDAPPILGDISRVEIAHRDVVDEVGAEIEVGEEAVRAQ